MTRPGARRVGIAVYALLLPAAWLGVWLFLHFCKLDDTGSGDPKACDAQVGDSWWLALLIVAPIAAAGVAAIVARRKGRPRLAVVAWLLGVVAALGPAALSVWWIVAVVI